MKARVTLSFYTFNGHITLTFDAILSILWVKIRETSLALLEKGCFVNIEIADLLLIACKQLKIQKLQENNCNNQMATEKENRGTVVLSFLCVPKKGCNC